MHRLSIAILFLIATLIQADTSSDAAEVPQEFRVKAGYLLNIPIFADQPPTPDCRAFTVCIIGDTPLQGVLQGMATNKRIKTRPVTIKTIDGASQLECCQVLFIASSERYRLQRLLTEAHRRGIITISDMRDFAKMGGMVSLETINNKIGYVINLTAGRSASVSFSSHLLKLAQDYIK